MFTTGNGNGFVGAKPTISGITRVLQWFREPAGQEQGTPVTAALMNDALDNIRAAATNAGVDLTAADRTIGDNQVLTEIIRGLGGISITNQVTNAYDNTAASGAMPLLVGYSGTNQRWVTANNASAEALLATSTLAFDTDLNAVTANTVVQGEFVGTFTCQLKSIAENGTASDKTAVEADEGKAVYLVIIGTTHSYCLFNDIHPLQQYRARQIGVIGNFVSASSVTVAFNTLVEPEKRSIPKRIWTGNTGHGTQPLISGESFSDYSLLIFVGGKDASGSPTGTRISVTVPYGVFRVQSIGTQESYASDAYWNVTWVSDSSFRVTGYNRNNTTSGLNSIWGIK